MKIARLKKIILVNIAFFIALCLSLAAIVFFIFNINADTIQEININKQQIKKFELENIKRKKHHLDLVKYSKNWQAIPVKSRFITGVKPNNFNDLIEILADKYSISNIQTSLKIPENLNSGIFRKDSILIKVISGNINYNSSDDIRSLKFLHEMFKSLPGEVIIKSITIVKAYEYSNEDFLAISKLGKIDKVRTRITFDWFYKDRK